MLLSDYLNISEIKPHEEACIESPKNFTENAVNAYRVMMGVEPHPIVFSHEKYFARHPVLNDVELNKKGQHLFRWAFGTYAARHRCETPEFLDRGLIIIEDFLDKDWQEELQREFETIPCAVNKQPFNLASNLMKMSNTYSAVNYTVNSSGLRELVQGCVGRHKQNATTEYREKSYAQRVENSPDDNDIQKVIHSDIFFPAIKWWYFPDEVKRDHGAFRYMTRPLGMESNFLGWLYLQSVRIAEGTYEEWRGKDHAEGSLRMSEEEISTHGYAMDQVTCKANTLVIGNVQNFHCRGNTIKPITRNAIHGSIRIEKPFVI